MKSQYEINLRIPEDVLRKFLYVASAEGRSPNNHILMLLRNNVQYFERAKGHIPSDAAAKIDLSAYQKQDADRDESIPSAQKKEIMP